MRHTLLTGIAGIIIFCGAWDLFMFLLVILKGALNDWVRIATFAVGWLVFINIINIIGRVIHGKEV